MELSFRSFSFEDDEAVFRSLHLDESKSNELIKIINYFTDPFLFNKLLRCELELPSELALNGDRIQCAFSYLSKDLRNLIIFEGGGEKFLVVQNVSSCDCLIFINHSFLRGIEPVHLSDIDYQGTYLKELDSWSVAHSESLVAAYSLKGILAYHRRPAHFFYDLAIGLEYFLGSLPSFSYGHLIAIDGGNYLDFAHMFPALKGLAIETMAINQVNELALKEKAVFFKPSVHYCYRKSLIYRSILRSWDCRLKLSLKVDRLIGHIQHAVLKAKQEGKCVVWIGISTSKRVFVDQLAFISMLLKSIQIYERNLCLIVDGWTSPLTPSENDASHICEDQRVFQDISLNDCSGMTCLSAIGLTAIEKAKLSSLVDFHITPCGTGSLWVSRFAKKPGVIHANYDYFFNSIGAQLYGEGSSLYPAEYSLRLLTSTKKDVHYFLFLKAFVDYSLRRFLVASSAPDTLHGRSGLTQHAFLYRVLDAKPCVNNDKRMPGFGWFSSLGDSKLTYILQEPIECSSRQSRLSIVVQFKDVPAVASGQICYMERVEEKELLRSVEFYYRCVNEAEMIFSASILIPNPSLWIRLNPLFNQASVFSILQIAFVDQPFLS